jgi:uncharacterized protein
VKPSRCIFAIVLFLGCIARAAEVIPPLPAQYFNDYAGVVSASTASQLNAQLTQFERDTSNQFLVVIYPKMQSDSSIEDYTVRVAEAWKVGQKLKNNGVVLFVFIQDHKLYIQVGYGLEGALPDAMAKRIIDLEITPAFKQGNYDAGLTDGVNAIIAATKGEYKGNGSTVGQSKEDNSGNAFIIVLIALLALAWIIRWIARAHAYSTYSSQGYDHGMWYWLLYSMLANSDRNYSDRGGWSGGGSSGGGFSGGGGGFSGGGGSFGGGGAGGSW